MTTRLEKVYAFILLVIFAGIVVHAPLSVGFGSLWPDYSLIIKGWKEILLLVAALLAAFIVTKRALWTQLLKDWLVRGVLLYIVLHIVLLGVRFQGVAAALAGLAIDLRYVVFFSLVYVLILIAPQYRRQILIVVSAGATLVVGFAAAQLFLPVDILSHIGYGKDTIAPFLTVDQNTDYVRVNSTLRGPNPLGAYVVIVLSILAAATAYGKIQLKDRRVALFASILAVLSLVALWISYSRSALLGVLVALAAVVIVAFGKQVPMRILLVLFICGLTIGGGLFVARDTSFVSNVILHDDPTEGGVVNSNDGHLESLQDGTKRIVRQPLGAGIGSTGSASLLTDAPVIIENQYLFIAHETGWLGLGLFVAIFAVILKRLWHRRQDWLVLGVFASGIGLAFIGLIQPVWVDDTVAIIWWGLAGLAIANRSTYGK